MYLIRHHLTQRVSPLPASTFSCLTGCVRRSKYEQHERGGPLSADLSNEGEPDRLILYRSPNLNHAGVHRHTASIASLIRADERTARERTETRGSCLRPRVGGPLGWRHWVTRTRSRSHTS